MDRYLGMLDTSSPSGENGSQHREPTQSNWHCPTTAVQPAQPAQKPSQTSWHCSPPQQQQQQQQQQQWTVQPDTVPTSEVDSTGFNVDRKELWSSQAIPSSLPINQSAPSLSADGGEYDMKHLCGLPMTSGGMDGVLDCTARPSLNGLDAVNSVNNIVNSPFMNTQLPMVNDAIIQNQVERMAVMTRLPPRRQRSVKKPIPEDQKDERYYEKRRRNNEAAKKSREMRKTREENVMIETSLLEESTRQMKVQLSQLNQRYKMLMQYSQKQKAIGVDGRLDLSPTITMPKLEEVPVPSLSEYLVWSSTHVSNFPQKSELEQGPGGLLMEEPQVDKDMLVFLQQHQQPSLLHPDLQHSPSQLLQQTPEHQQQDMRTPPNQPRRGELMSELQQQSQRHLQPLQHQKPDMQQEMQPTPRQPRRRHRQSQMPLVDDDMFSELQQQHIQLMQGQEMHGQKHEMQHRQREMQPQQRQQQEMQQTRHQQQQQQQLLHQQQVQMNTPVSNAYFNAPA